MEHASQAFDSARWQAVFEETKEEHAHGVDVQTHIRISLLDLFQLTPEQKVALAGDVQLCYSKGVFKKKHSYYNYKELVSNGEVKIT